MNRKFRALLVLGRVSNLPTVWSNCLAGWWLSGGENFWKLPLLLIGASALYAGGMFLNDAFDVEFDRQRRSSRPIPSGAISLDGVLISAWALLVAGILCLVILGKVAAFASVLLAATIVIYNATHKLFTASPWLMGLCRFWVYVIAGTTGRSGLNGWPIWCGMALAFYIVGLSYVARRESFRGTIPYWPLVFLIGPVALAMLMNSGPMRVPALWLSLILIFWIVRCARTVFLGGEIAVSRIVSGLLAGIVFVDWLALAPVCPPLLSATFLLLFASTLLLQRFIPAT
ncbi:MAG TPA: UbiA family prenyltransferase [Verrucomicrobiae bacterium]|nr:UbiA family prenyltransferase [Verrucomicrobiae bacterium]